MGFSIRGFIWDIPILIFAYVPTDKARSYASQHVPLGFPGPRLATARCRRVPRMGFRGLGSGFRDLGYRVKLRV